MRYPSPSRRELLAALAAPASGARAAKDRPPNIVLILADDLGFSDLGCYGGEIHTPNLDRLASQGVRVAQFYSCARCCPTRSSLLTGLYPHQAGIGYMEPTHKYARGVDKMRLPQYQGFLNRNCATLAEALKPAGYQCFLSGKWHVGRDPGQRPWERGFDRFYGILGGAVPYFKPPSGQVHDGAAPAVIAENFYSTDAFTDRALQFLNEADASRPQFLYLAYTAPHFNLDAWPKDIEKYRGRYRVGWDTIRQQRFARQVRLGLVPASTKLSPRHPRSPAWENESRQDLMDLKMSVYAATVERMDWNIGRVLDQIQRSGQEENTVVVFLSDNGGEMLGRYQNPQPPFEKRHHATYDLSWGNVSNTPFRLFKQTMHEGGISEPFIARWPGHFPANRIVRRGYGHVRDLMPTFLDLAGGSYPRQVNGNEVQPLEGASLRSLLSGKAPSPAPPIFWEHGGNRAVRDGKWKLVSYYNEVEEDPVTYGLGVRTGPWELYDMERDRSECSDLAAKEPGRVRRMAAQYESWARRVGVVPWEDILRAGDWLSE